MRQKSHYYLRASDLHLHCCLTPVEGKIQLIERSPLRSKLRFSHLCDFSLWEIGSMESEPKTKLTHHVSLWSIV